MIDPNPSALKNIIQLLLSEAGISLNFTNFSSIRLGGNNRIWLIKSDHKCYVVKQYFQHPDDLRNRLKADFEFSKYVHQLCSGVVPEPIAVNFDENLAVYEYIDGLSLLDKKISLADVIEAANFFKLINPPNRFNVASYLGKASEACFSISDHISFVENRINNLLNALSVNGLDSDVNCFLLDLKSYWLDLKKEVNNQLIFQQLSADLGISKEQFCISPSDFGFHNAIQKPSGKIIFLDFEYAGWDDPAKMVGDFFAQLAVPVPIKYFDKFCEKAFCDFPGAKLIIERAKLLLPVYQVKWCCIALNVISPASMARRKFANPSIDEHQLVISQLAKAEEILKKLKKDESYGLY